MKSNLLSKICLSEMSYVYYIFCSLLWASLIFSLWTFSYTKSFGAHDFVFCKVFSSFASAATRIRMAGLKKFLRPGSSKDIDENFSQYNFGMVLKETMLSLGPTFIKGQKCGLVEARELNLLSHPLHSYFSLSYMPGIWFFFCSHKLIIMLVTCICLVMQLVSPFPQDQILLVLKFPRLDYREYISYILCGNL